MDLCITNLSGVTLKEADLSESDLRYANMRGTTLSNANLSGTKIVSEQLDQISKSEEVLRKEGVEVDKDGAV